MSADEVSLSSFPDVWLSIDSLVVVFGVLSSMSLVFLCCPLLRFGSEAYYVKSLDSEINASLFLFDANVELIYLQDVEECFSS